MMFLSVSDGTEALLGFKPDDFLAGKVSLKSLVHADDQDIASDLFSNQINNNSGTFNIRLRQANGRIRCVKGYYTKEFISSSSETILELRLQDAKSLWQDQGDQPMMINFNALMENTDDYIYFKDRNHVFNGASQSLVAITSPSEHWTDLLGLTDYDVFPEEYADIYYRLEKQVFAGLPVAHEIQETLDKDGNKGWVDNRKYPIKNKQGEIIGLFGLARDITERRHIEDAQKEALSLLQAVTDRVPGVVYQYRLRPDSSSCFPYSSSAIREIYRVSPEEVREDASKVFAILHPDDLGGIVESIQKSAAQLTPWKHEYRVKFEDGTVRWLLGDALPSKEADGSVMWHGFITDITERKLDEESLKLSNLVYQNSSEAMLVTDSDNCIVAINPAFTLVTGYTTDEILGKNPSILRSDIQDARFYKDMWESINNKGSWRGEIWNRRKNGELYAELLAINTIYGKDGLVHRRVALFSDITEKKEAEALILKQANYDQLTQLPNRRLLQDRLGQEIKKAQREQYSIALLFIDLDRFKEVNDTQGHDVGDLLLIETADRIKSCVRDYDTLARLGGDEFTVILAELSDTSDIGRIAQNLIDSISKPFLIKGNESFVSASIGIALYPEDATHVSDLLKHADQAMYQAKQEGRGRFHFFTSAMQEASEYRILLANELRHALDNNQLEVYYQSIVDLTDGTINKAEALLRWNHPKLGQVSPATFIPIAEDTGSIHEIGDWVFEQVAIQASKLKKELGRDFQISVNKSPVQFNGNDRLHGRWIEKLEEIGLPGHNIVVEITEGLLMNTSDKVTGSLLQFRDAGIQVSIDDFGTGYSALSYLKKFDIDYLKIDQSFIRNLALESEDFALCEAIVVMAHKLGIKVIAEGVETEHQRNLLRQIGCDYGQGYLFSMPMPVKVFETFLKKK